MRRKPVQPQSAPSNPLHNLHSRQFSNPPHRQLSSEQKPVQQATSQKSVKTTQQQRVSAGSSKSKTSKFRGDAAEAKKKRPDEFMALYDSLPKVLTNEPGIQIALAIIKRFRVTFMEKEGFTYRENWRVTQEIETLKRLKANK